MWTAKHEAVLAAALERYDGNLKKLDLVRLESLVPAKVWKQFALARGDLRVGVAVQCALACQLCPLCNLKFLGTSNRRLRAYCKSCKGDPRAKETVFLRKQATLVENYGSLDAAVQASNSKKRETCLAKFGHEHAFQSSKVKHKIRKTCLDRYGVEYPTKSAEIKARVLATNLERYHTAYPMSNPEVRDKGIATLKERYGVTNMSQIPEVKAKKSCYILR